jgi:hypothetical protein
MGIQFKQTPVIVGTDESGDDFDVKFDDVGDLTISHEFGVLTIPGKDAEAFRDAIDKLIPSSSKPVAVAATTSTLRKR